MSAHDGHYGSGPGPSGWPLKDVDTRAGAHSSPPNVRSAPRLKVEEKGEDELKTGKKRESVGQIKRNRGWSRHFPEEG